ncbi:unnamed protein product [Fraxinus pennsylvanica]|uniref:Terpene synthase metal-binding domain-containing protein n=1 Tax=Fraxinus pennsylvanica TaxID=56036 RepID=A0AAD1YUI3_9LAMI|nr:unnamed protein product [Fraxinus pennsylvanica]
MQTKVIAMLSVIDDIYDIYGTLDELTLLMDAIERWDLSLVDQLPPYMKYYYKALLDVYVEIEEELGKTGKSYLVHYVIDEKTSTVGCYMNQNNGASKEEAFAEIQKQVTNAWKVKPRMPSSCCANGFPQASILIQQTN